MVQEMANILSIIIALCTVIMLASANVSSHNISELQNSIDALINKVNMLVKSSQNNDNSNKMVANLVQLSINKLSYNRCECVTDWWVLQISIYH